MQSEILNVPLRGEPPLTQANAACVGGTPRRGNSKPSWLAQCKTDSVRTILNLIWLVLSGFWLGLAYAIAGVIMCVLVITIPFGVASFRLAAYVLWPFGRTVIRRPGAGAASMVGNVLWFLLAGVWIAIAWCSRYER